MHLCWTKPRRRPKRWRWRTGTTNANDGSLPIMYTPRHCQLYTLEPQPLASKSALVIRTKWTTSNLTVVCYYSIQIRMVIYWITGKSWIRLTTTRFVYSINVIWGTTIIKIKILKLLNDKQNLFKKSKGGGFLLTM